MGQAKARLLSLDPPGLPAVAASLHDVACEARYPVDVVNTVLLFVDPRQGDGDPVAIYSIDALCSYVDERFGVEWAVDPGCATCYLVVEGPCAVLDTFVSVVQTHVANVAVYKLSDTACTVRLLFY